LAVASQVAGQAATAEALASAQTLLQAGINAKATPAQAQSIAQAAIAAFVGSAPAELDTWPEVVAYLTNLSATDAGVAGQLTTLTQQIAAKYTKPSGGIPLSDLAAGVIPDVSGLLSKTDAAGTYGQKTATDANTAAVAALPTTYLAKPTVAGTSGQVLTVQADGTNAWMATVARQVVEHGSVAATIRPTTSGPVTWIGSVQPTNWLDGDDWYEATAVVVDIPTANLVNYWRAEDLTLTSGQAVTTMANRVNGGPALTAAGGPVFNVESSVSSVLLDGVDDQLSETTTALNQPTTTITVGRYVVGAASKPWVGAATNLHAITATSASKWSVNAGTSLAHTASIDTGWHMVAAVFNGTSTIIYVDGVAVTGTGGTNARAGTRIGANSGQTAFANMKFTMTAQYGTAMTTADLDSMRSILKTRYPVLP